MKCPECGADGEYIDTNDDTGSRTCRRCPWEYRPSNVSGSERSQQVGLTEYTND